VGTQHFPKFVIWLVLLAQVVASCVPAPTASPISPAPTVTSEPPPTLAEATATPFPASPIGMIPPDGAIAVNEMPESLQVVVKNEADVEKAVALLGGGGDQVKALVARAKEALPNGVSFAEMRIGTNKHWGTLIIGSDGKAYTWVTADGVNVASLNPYGTVGADLQAFGLQEVGGADEVEFAQEESGWVVLTKQRALWRNMAAKPGEKPWQMIGTWGGEPVADERGLIERDGEVFLYNEAVGGLVRGTKVVENVMVIDGLVHEWNADTEKWEGRGVSANAVEIGGNGEITLKQSGKPRAVVDASGTLRIVEDGYYSDSNGDQFKWESNGWRLIDPFANSGIEFAEGKKPRLESSEVLNGLVLVKDEDGAIVGVGSKDQVYSGHAILEQIEVDEEIAYEKTEKMNFSLSPIGLLVIEGEKTGPLAFYNVKSEKWQSLVNFRNELAEKHPNGHYYDGIQGIEGRVIFTKTFFESDAAKGGAVFPVYDAQGNLLFNSTRTTAGIVYDGAGNFKVMNFSTRVASSDGSFEVVPYNYVVFPELDDNLKTRIANGENVGSEKELIEVTLGVMEFNYSRLSPGKLARPVLNSMTVVSTMIQRSREAYSMSLNVQTQLDWFEAVMKRFSVEYGDFLPSLGVQSVDSGVAYPIFTTIPTVE